MKQDLKTFALHFNCEYKPFRPANIVRWGTVKAKNKREAKTKLLGMYCEYQTTSTPPKGYTIDELN